MRSGTLRGARRPCSRILSTERLVQVTGREAQDLASWLGRLWVLRTPYLPEIYGAVF